MSKFAVRTSCPNNNKNYIRTANGGWNTCIQGKPKHPTCNVLANCVGYASGRFNEIINDAKGTTGCAYKTLNCNAENFIERAKSAGLKVGSTPKVGAIMCWQRGKTLSGKDGAGHVAVVERVYSSTSVYTSESGYGNKYFWNSTRSKGSGGWGIGGNYKFRGFIYLPDAVQKIVDAAVKPAPKPSPSKKVTPTVARNKNNNQIQVLVTKLNVRTGAGTSNKSIGFASKGYYNYSATKSANGYTWYQIATNQWIASNKGWTTVLPKATPKPAPKPSKTLKVGDKVKIVARGYSNAYGKGGRAAGGVGWTRKILKIWSGYAYPYQVGEGKATTGFYKASALKK